MAVEVVSREEFVKALARTTRVMDVPSTGGRKRAKQSRAEVVDDPPYTCRCHTCSGEFPSANAFERHSRGSGHVRGDLVL